jgi:hypothetical protein
LLSEIERMSDKMGRNDPCPCGSGKKYKKCCILTSSVAFPVADFEWRKLRQLEGIVVDRHLLSYTAEELPVEAVKLALSDFFPDDLPDTLDEEVLFHHFFIPWFLFNWIPFEGFDLPQFNPEQTLARNYVNVHASRLNSLERRFIEAMYSTYYSFYTILEVEPEKSLLVKDILLGTLHTLKERQGTYTLKRGDIVFGRILTLDEQSIFVGMAPYIVPADYYIQLIEFRKWLIKENNNTELTGDVLREVYDIELLNYFFDILKAAYDRPFPELANTDGEPLQFCKTYFKLTLTPEEALQQLLCLALSKDPAEFLHEASYDKKGKVKRIELPWLKKGNKQHKHWNNTVMGHLIIEKGKLILETNSEQRAERGKKLLSKTLGDAIVFQKMLIESPEQKLKSQPKSHPAAQEANHLLELPEVQAQVKAMAKAHWENWLNESIPALDNQTPREAAKNDREKLEALLLQYERHDAEKGNNLFKADIADLKTKLGLDEPLFG